MRFLFSVCVFLIPYWLQAQLGGDATFRFLELSSSPRALALANPVTLEDNDISTALGNPALIRSTHGGQVMVTYEPYFDCIHRGGGAYTYAINRKTALAFDVNYINYGTFSGADEFGNPTSDFSGNEVAIGIGSSYYMLAANLHVGGRLRYIRSTLESYSSSGISADMGLYYAPIGSSWRFGLVYQHLGKQLTAYEDIIEPLPANLTFSFSNALRYLPLRWHVSFHHLNKWPLLFENPEESITSFNGGSTQQSTGIVKKLLRHSSFGVELFPEGLFSLRFGYHVQRAAELRILDIRNFSGLSIGVGIQMRRLRFQLAHARYNVAGNRTYIGVTLESKP